MILAVLLLWLAWLLFEKYVMIKHLCAEVKKLRKELELLAHHNKVEFYKNNGGINLRKYKGLL